jgi:hypothetical protein
MPSRRLPGGAEGCHWPGGALEHFGRWRVDARADAGCTSRCEYLRVVRAAAPSAATAGLGTGGRSLRGPTDRDGRDAGLSAPGPTRLKARLKPPRRPGPQARTRRVGRQHQAEAGALAGLRSRTIDLAAVALHHVLDDRQPQAGAAGLARAAAVHAVEALGQTRQVLAGDADAGVADLEFAAAVFTPAPRQAMRPPSGV